MRRPPGLPGGNSDEANEADRLPAGAELLELPGLVAPSARRRRLPHAEYYEHIARTLEDGKFHLAFFDDRLAMPDRLRRRLRATVRHGIRAVKMDPIAVLIAMGLATDSSASAVTYSTTYYEPFHVARVFATLDLHDSTAAPPGTSSPR